MLSENIRTLRKQRGMSQETLAQQLNVVRQTVSKWEKGLSVPDADMLVRLSELFEVPVGDLLGEKIEANEDVPDVRQIATQLALLNDQLAAQATRRRNAIKGGLVALGISLVVTFALVAAMNCSAHETGSRQDTATTASAEVTAEYYVEARQTSLDCMLNDKSYYFVICYDKSGYILWASYVADDMEEFDPNEWINYEDLMLDERAQPVIDALVEYVESHGGTVRQSTDDVEEPVDAGYPGAIQR